MEQEIKMIADSEPLNATIRAMKPGERVAFSAARFGSVRSAVSNFNFISENVRYTSKADRPNRRIIVTREV